MVIICEEKKIYHMGKYYHTNYRYFLFQFFKGDTILIQFYYLHLLFSILFWLLLFKVLTSILRFNKLGGD